MIARALGRVWADSGCLFYGRVMNMWAAAAWGLAGGFCVEALELYVRIRRTPKWNWRQPIPQGMAAFAVSVLVRLGVGAVLAAATAGSRQISSPLAAFGLGVAAPLVIEKLARGVPLTALSQEEEAADISSMERVDPAGPATVESPGVK